MNAAPTSVSGEWHFSHWDLIWSAMAILFRDGRLVPSNSLPAMVAIDEDIGEAGAPALGAIGVDPIAHAGDDAGRAVDTPLHVFEFMLCAGWDRRARGR